MQFLKLQVSIIAGHEASGAAANMEQTKCLTSMSNRDGPNMKVWEQQHRLLSAQLQLQSIFNDVEKVLSPWPSRGIADRTHGPNRDKDGQRLCDNMKRVNDPGHCIGRDE